ARGDEHDSADEPPEPVEVAELATTPGHLRQLHGALVDDKREEQRAADPEAEPCERVRGAEAPRADAVDGLTARLCEEHQRHRQQPLQPKSVFCWRTTNGVATQSVR